VWACTGDHISNAALHHRTHGIVDRVQEQQSRTAAGTLDG
jgi:hypothetical protein